MEVELPQVTFLPSNVSVEVETGEVLLRAAMLAGVHINASCGGQGACGKCRVLVESGVLEDGVSERLSEEDRQAGYRLACKALVTEDVAIRIPIESQLDSKLLDLAPPGRGVAFQLPDKDADWLKEHDLFAPPFELRYLEIDPPDAANNENDLKRLLRNLKDAHGEGGLQVDIEFIRKLPDVIREDDFKVTITMARPVKEERQTTLTNVQPGDRTRENYALAIDIGTTTVYGQILDMYTGQVLAQQGKYNGQISYGEDVITRIMYAVKPGGLEKMQQVVVETINEIIARLAKKTGVNVDDISYMTVAGNTTMTQLFLAVQPKYIRLSPYTPATCCYPLVKAVDLGLDVGRHVPVLVFPALASYVGGDVVAGVLGSGMYREEELTLFIDLGTNGEIVVGNKDWLACAACSAGPAFEGGGIEHGMRATKGAIEDFSLNPITYEPMITTVGMAKPRGICGSGLINIVAALFEAGLIDGRGKFRTDLPTDRIRESENGPEYLLAEAEATDIGRDITLNEIDIDNLMRAKGAMYAGYVTLLEGVGLSVEMLDRVILAGGFGRYVNIEKAITIGLLPELPLSKFSYVGNGSLLGARMVALSNKLRSDVWHIVNNTTNFELSEVPSYMDYYMSALFLPHTEQQYFPDVTRRVGELQKALGRGAGAA